MMTRRQLLGLSAGAGASLTIGMLPGVKEICGKSIGKRAPLRLIKISPMPGIQYSQNALNFMSHARFETPRQAIYGMKDPNVEFLIEYVSAS